MALDFNNILFSLRISLAKENRKTLTDFFIKRKAGKKLFGKPKGFLTTTRGIFQYRQKHLIRRILFNIKTEV